MTASEWNKELENRSTADDIDRLVEVKAAYDRQCAAINSYRKDLAKAEQDTDRARAMRDHYRAALTEIVALTPDKRPVDYGATGNCDDDFVRGHESAGYYVGDIARGALEDQS